METDGSKARKDDERRLHQTVGFLGLRAQATAVGLLQLCAELRRAGTLDDEALARIKDAILGDLMLSRPQSQQKDAYEASLRRRLDQVFAYDVHKGEQEPLGQHAPA